MAKGLVLSVRKPESISRFMSLEIECEAKTREQSSID